MSDCIAGDFAFADALRAERRDEEAECEGSADGAAHSVLRGESSKRGGRSAAFAAALCLSDRSSAVLSPR